MAAITSARAGNWSDPGTWTGGALPAATDTVTITHAVVLDINERDGSKLYGRVSVNTNGSLTHDPSKETCICIKGYLYINGGKYEMTPKSTVKFNATSKSSSVEGTGLSGIYAVGSVAGTQMILNGSVPMPETSLVSDALIGDHILKVSDASGFAPGEFIAVYYDQANESPNQWGWMGRNMSDEGFIVHKVVGNDIWIRQRVGVEDKTTSSMAIGQTWVTVQNARKWQTGMKLYIDDEVFVVSDTDLSNNRVIFTTSAASIHAINAPMYETGMQKRHVHDYLVATSAVNAAFVSVFNAAQFKVGGQVKIDNEVLTISSLDIPNKRLYFTPRPQVAHGINRMVTDVSGTSHATGDKVYKIATVTRTASAANATTITVANAAKLEVGDRIVIEGIAKVVNPGANGGHETFVNAKNGNVLTLATPIPYATEEGFIVTKTSRDCVVTTTNPNDDANRTWIYYTSGTSSIANRKMIMRYAEISHVGSYTDVYAGVTLRSDFNRLDCEGEIRGNVVRDGWNIGRSGIWLHSLHYVHARNNVVVKCENGINPYASNGNSVYNNITIGNYNSSYQTELPYYYNQFQYNIGLNTRYANLYYSDYNAVYPEWHNIFKHHERPIYFGMTCIGSQYGTWIKNRYIDSTFRHYLAEGTRIIIQDIDVIDPTSGLSWGNHSSAYGNYDERGLVGGMLVIVNKDMIRGNFEMHGAGGIVQKDETTHLGNGWSYKYIPNNGSVDIRISQMIYAKSGVPMRVVAYMRKNASYNGTYLPGITVKGQYLERVYQEMQNVNDQWVRVEASFTTPRGEMVEIGIGGRGTTGNFWIDPRVSVTTHDMDLIQGPYSVNLMFGLEQIYEDNPGVVLGGITI